MKTYLVVVFVCIVAGCGTGHEKAIIPLPPSVDEDAGAPPQPAVNPDAGAALVELDAALPQDAGSPLLDARTPVAEKEVDAKVERPMDAATDSGAPDAGALDAAVDAAGPDAGHPSVDAGPPRENLLRSLSLDMSGMDADLRRFSQFRVATQSGEFFVICVIHEGFPTAAYTLDLPNSLFVGESYTLYFFLDHDNSGGYNPPPVDHAWRVPIPAGNGDVVINFPYNTDFFDIESTVPDAYHPLILTSHDMWQYDQDLFDVRVIDRATGRLAGRQVREVPGDSFDLTVGYVLHEGTEYQVDISVDLDADGKYTRGVDPGWRMVGVATATGLFLDFSPSAPQVDLTL